MIALASAAFVAIFFSRVPFPVIVFAAGVIGFSGARIGSAAFVVGEGHGPAKATPAESLLGEELPEHARPTVARALRVSAVWLALWLVPVIAIIATLGIGHTFAEIGVFFSKMAVVTFGGAWPPWVSPSARSSRKRSRPVWRDAICARRSPRNSAGDS